MSGYGRADPRTCWVGRRRDLDHAARSPSTSTSNITDRLAAQGYTARRAEILALTALEQQPDGARILLLEGPPGAGKTYLAACYAAATGARQDQ
jgi:MoxR-like ATPase